ncbi:MAG: DegT/DnrJ/EryC1/StrS family aminotransferase [Acidobacteria bacterium]|nr:MAG: DegT/DnrJ/EryC1/StrS family aminotransferase [Acidobacteriota bacterium]REJ99084.1 MAG: DegT/DnrJ/EryC1/StrS family aminotransferase [Acidobacteriota bacterium]REK16196.1 MAG: DegT/DnrJ/EryC1/StrS family aminotransferase [Acidobacteriota bacterium]REK43877.1 MAG: DegT/DnrJ/EryC1/StrS family aminotransferase [Acidobacteriota bacterium]
MINVTKTFLPPKEEYEDLLDRIWKSSWLTNRGELVKRLERDLKEYLAVEDLLCVNNGTIALQLPIRAMDLSGEIVTTPFSYVATTSSIVWEHCTPVFADIEADNLTIDPSAVEAAVTDRTSAILATHVFGNPCDVDALQDIAKSRGLKLIYDAAHCFGVTYRGESLLRWGDASTLSFHATKLFHTGEGGAVVCNDPELSEKVYFAHNFGHDGPEKFRGLGINAKMSELQAAMGLAILPHMDRILDDRRRVTESYDELLNFEAFAKPSIRDDTGWNYAYYPVIFERPADLEQCIGRLNEQDIFPRRYFYPSLDSLPYVSTTVDLAVSRRIAENILCLPLFTDLGEDAQETICNTLNG